MRHHETEIKIAIADVAGMRRRLKRLGYRPIHRRALEDNVLLDTPDRALRAVRSILRLRRYGSRWWLTFKGTPEPDSRYKSRAEYELEIGRPEALRSIFQALGLGPVFRYQKYRTHYAASGGKVSAKKARKPAFEITLDETPIGNFIELEGSPAAIDRAARMLGFTTADYSTASYGALYLEQCRKEGAPPGDMVFANIRKRRASR